MARRAQTILLLSALAVLSACATDRTFGTSPDIEITSLEELPRPSTEFYYAIGPNTKLEIEVVNAEELSGTFVTDPDGSLAFPYLGNLAAGGKTPATLAQLIAEGLRGKYLLDPQVRVVPEEVPLPSISVGGQVNKPGSYPALGKQTLLRVVNDAEGLAEYAQLDDALIMRIVDGQRYIGLYNIGAIQRGNYPDPELYPNDIVMVGDSPARRRLDNILQFAPLLSASAIVIDRLGR